jgi:hypothetical protein
VGFVEGDTGYCSETCVMCDVGGTGEVLTFEEAIDIREEVRIKVEDPLDIKEDISIKVEETVDIKDETPQALFPPIMSEHEVSLWGVCCVCVVCVMVWCVLSGGIPCF